MLLKMSVFYYVSHIILSINQRANISNNFIIKQVALVNKVCGGESHLSRDVVVCWSNERIIQSTDRIGEATVIS